MCPLEFALNRGFLDISWPIGRLGGHESGPGERWQCSWEIWEACREGCWDRYGWKIGERDCARNGKSWDGDSWQVREPGDCLETSVSKCAMVGVYFGVARTMVSCPIAFPRKRVEVALKIAVGFMVT